MQAFTRTDILLPDTKGLDSWAVIACDQFTSEPEYWQEVAAKAADGVSALHLILPETELSGDYTARIPAIHETMRRYLHEQVFRKYADAYIYVERTLKNGAIRRGVVGALDLDAYDYATDATSAVRATERTVVERIPPRKKVRQGAPLELSHVLLLCDDDRQELIERLTEQKSELPLLYSFDLMMDGGKIEGWLVQGAAADAFDSRLATYVAGAPERYRDLSGTPMLFAVGDGNHSLATAKACYEELKKQHPNEDMSAHPARFAMVELENIRDEVQGFEPIHRLVKNVDPAALLEALQQSACAPDGYPVTWCAGTQSGTVYLDRNKGQLPVGILQQFLDDYMHGRPEDMDYIHGDDTVRRLAGEPNTVGFLLPAIAKEELFRGIVADGVLPRKTFSMGHAQEKRYYLEARKIEK